MKQKYFSLIFAAFIAFFCSCSDTAEDKDPRQLLIAADSIAATINSAEYIILRSYKSANDSGFTEYGVSVRRNPSDQYGFSYKIVEQGKVFAIYHNGSFMLVNQNDKIVMVPDSSRNPLDFASTYRHALSPVITQAPHSDKIKAAKHITYLGIDDVSGSECHVVSMQDTTAAEATSVNCYLDSKTGSIIKFVTSRTRLAEMVTKEDIIVIKNLKINPLIDESVFKFQIPADYRIHYVGRKKPVINTETKESGKTPSKNK